MNDRRVARLSRADVFQRAVEFGERIGAEYPDVWADLASVTRSLRPQLDATVREDVALGLLDRFLRRRLVPLAVQMGLDAAVAKIQLRQYDSEVLEDRDKERFVALRSKEPSPRKRVAPRVDRLAPEAQPFGVSHEGAESLVAQWMRWLGDDSATVTRFSRDGGVDVRSDEFAAQVKNYSGAVGVAEVRELLGAAIADGRKPIFFTSGRYSTAAVQLADLVGMPLFVYDANKGGLGAANSHAEVVESEGLAGSAGQT